MEMKKNIVLSLLFSFVVVLSAYAQSMKLQFQEGCFKILQLTDLHWIESENYKLQNDSTYYLIREMIRIERPDLVVLTGDVVVSWNAKKAWNVLVDLFAKERTPFVVTFGNHDEETDMNNSQILELLSTNPYNLTYDAENGGAGTGNCFLPIYASDGMRQKWMLYFFDSHNITNDRSFGYYDWIKSDQVDWYRRVSKGMKREHGEKLPALAFFHIPLPEHESARWVCRELGNKMEDVCASSVNSGLFASFIENRDVIGVFVGHDHNNDYLVDLDGNIVLAYGRKTGYPSAYKETLSRGVRVITLQEDAPAFNTYIRDLAGIYFNYDFEQKYDGIGIPRFNGSFIQKFLVADWDDARWDKEMDMLKEIGMNYLIYAPALLVDAGGRISSNYPSSYVKRRKADRTLERCLHSAQKKGIKVFVGLNFNERWWKNDYDDAWLTGQMKIGNKIASELIALYKDKYPDAFYGWYWVWEVDNLNWMSTERQESLSRALNVNLDHLSKIAPGMPLMLSPFMNHKVGSDADGYAEMWKNVFAKAHFRSGDIFAPQDCIGAGGLNLDILGEWFSKLKQAVNSKPGLKFWGNVETFEQAFWSTASLKRLQKQLEIVNGYVSNLICFAYSHYNSPFVGCGKYHAAYASYCQNGCFPEVSIPAKVTSCIAVSQKEGVKLQWSVQDETDVVGYNLYRDGVLVKKLQATSKGLPLSYWDKEGCISSLYEISSYNVFGEESEKISVTWE